MSGENQDLRTRIAAIQKQHRLGHSLVRKDSLEREYYCLCGWFQEDKPDTTWEDHPAHVADELIRNFHIVERTIPLTDSALEGTDDD